MRFSKRRTARPLALLSSLPLATLCLPTSGAPLGNYLRVDTFIYSEAITIKALGDNWRAPLHGGEVAMATGRMEAGVSWGQWQLGAIRREDYFYRFDADTARLIHASKNKIPLTPGDEYNIALATNSQQSYGMKLGYRLALHTGLNGTLAVSLLRGTEMMDGGLQGSARVIDDKDYDIAFDVDYRYSEDALFDRQTARPDGAGYAIDLALSWQATPQWRLDFTGLDLLARITWYNAPFTRASGNSDNKEYDDNGYVVYKPAISGLESNRDATQTLPRKLFLNSHYQLTRQLALLAEYSDYDIQRFFSAGLAFHLNDSQIALLYDVANQAYSARLNTPHLQFKLSSDASEINRARLVALSLALQWQY